jgi:uncharacterized DUF497 family protein
MFTWDPQKAILNFEKHGASLIIRILLVVYTIRRTADGKQEIRIISARQASRRERKAYAGQRD